jgi:hypothetical protein
MIRRRTNQPSPEVAPLPTSVRFHLATGGYAERGQFPDGVWAAILMRDEDKARLWSEYGELIGREARARGWRQRPRSWRPWQTRARAS